MSMQFSTVLCLISTGNPGHLSLLCPTSQAATQAKILNRMCPVLPHRQSRTLFIVVSNQSAANKIQFRNKKENQGSNLKQNSWSKLLILILFACLMKLVLKRLVLWKFITLSQQRICYWCNCFPNWPKRFEGWYPEMLILRLHHLRAHKTYWKSDSSRLHYMVISRQQHFAKDFIHCSWQGNKKYFKKTSIDKAITNYDILNWIRIWPKYKNKSFCLNQPEGNKSLQNFVNKIFQQEINIKQSVWWAWNDSTDVLWKTKTTAKAMDIYTYRSMAKADTLLYFYYIFY